MRPSVSDLRNGVRRAIRRGSGEGADAGPIGAIDFVSSPRSEYGNISVGALKHAVIEAAFALLGAALGDAAAAAPEVLLAGAERY